MSLQALLVSPEAEVHRTMRRILDAANVEVEICPTTEQARQSLSRRKYDTVLVDCDDLADGGEVLRDLRKGKSNRSCIAFALVRDTTIQQAFAMGANFVLDKPISLERATRSVRAAQGLIIGERRRYHRQPLNLPGILLAPGVNELAIKVTNVSHGGVSIVSPQKLDRGTRTQIKFVLPGGKKPFEAKCDVMWSTPDGRSGLRFQMLIPDAKKEFESWLETRIVPLAGVPN